MKRKLLIVDDEQGIVDMMRSYFSEEYDVLTAYNPDFYSFIIKTPYIARKYSICRVFLVLCSFP